MHVLKQAGSDTPEGILSLCATGWGPPTIGKKIEMSKIALGLFFVTGNHDNFDQDVKGLYLDIWAPIVLRYGYS
jgi:hypothetical protein